MQISLETYERLAAQHPPRGDESWLDYVERLGELAEGEGVKEYQARLPYKDPEDDLSDVPF